MRFISTILGAVLLLPCFAVAQSEFDLSQLGKGEVLLHLSAGESDKVEQDLLIASLQYSAEGKDTVQLQDEVNKVMKKAIALAKEVKDVDYSTEQYSVYVFDSGYRDGKPGAEPRWRAQQSLRIESKNSVALLELAGKLQGSGLHMSYLNYALSTEKYEQVSDGLMKGALMKLQARADEAANVLKKSSATLIDISLDGSNSFVQPRMMAMSKMSLSSVPEVETPSAVPGETQVSLTVTAKALLKP